MPFSVQISHNKVQICIRKKNRYSIFEKGKKMIIPKKVGFRWFATSRLTPMSIFFVKMCEMLCRVRISLRFQFPDFSDFLRLFFKNSEYLFLFPPLVGTSIFFFHGIIIFSPMKKICFFDTDRNIDIYEKSRQCRKHYRFLSRLLKKSFFSENHDIFSFFFPKTMKSLVFFPRKPWNCQFFLLKTVKSLVFFLTKMIFGFRWISEDLPFSTFFINFLTRN